MTFIKCASAVALLRLVPSIASLVLVTLFTLGACGSSDPQPFDPNSVARDGGNGIDVGGDDAICLLNNCATNDDCTDCSNGRTTCLTSEHRCIACQPGSSGTCPPGEYCTKYGDCVPNGKSCDEDPSGNVNITCGTDADCAACSPKHHVCDAAQHKCVGCVAGNVANCQSTDVCVNDACVPKCPATCNADVDCAHCGAPGHESHVCNNHRCAACSPTAPCANGGVCDEVHGVCQPACGVTGHPQSCTTNTDCAGCKLGTTSCDLPVNGGLGTCSKPATGCSDLGKGVAVLPAPFDTVTNLCSNDTDCKNIDADVNVGKALRDLTGISGIGDGSISYGMHACASVKIINHVSCGVCVPCKVDSDCQPIDITQVAGNVFGAVGSIASRILLDKVFGPSDHKVHMYCDPIVDGYGACVPCSDFLHACGSNAPPPPQGAPCNHEICTTGGPLGTNCNQCTADICKNDPFCCDPSNGAWDEACKTEVDVYCQSATCAPPDSCFGKQANTWYCSDITPGDAYHCDDQTHVDKPFSCPQSQYCHKTGTGPKDPAVLDGTGNPQCFTTP